MKVYQRRSTMQWQTLVDQHKESGLSARVFCRQHSLGYAGFMAWRKRLNQSDTDPACGEISPPFIELTLPESMAPVSSWSVELDLGQGVQLRIARR